MGLFDRFKKQNTQEEVKAEAVEAKAEAAEAVAEAMEEKAEAAEAIADAVEAKAETVEATQEAEKKETAEPVSGVANEERRFTLMVEECYKLSEEQSVVIVGNLQGSIQKGDSVYVLHPNGSIALSKVEDLEVGPGRATDRAENERVALRLADAKEKNLTPKFTVLTNIKPQTTVDENTEVENPQLLGLSIDYPKWYQDPAYLNLLIYVICHTNYVVPVNVDNSQGGGKQPMLRFPSLQNPANPGQNVFPVFTDNVALDKWKNIFDEKHPKKTMNLKFPDVVAISNGTGVVINPFGPTSIMLTPQHISQIVNMEGYKQEFGAKEGDNVKKVQMEQEGKILVGVPKEDKEIKMIREAIATYAKQEKDIKRVDFLLKVDVKQERAYLCVVDCPEEKAPKLFSGIHKAASPYFGEVKSMEFLLHGKSKLAMDVVSEKSIVYQV